MMNDFKTDVENGLNSDPKRLPSKYFYNEIGDELFVRIMNLPEYYLTRAEFEIFSEQTPDLVQSLNLDKTIPFELVELGAGDGTKTKELLKYLVGEGFQFDYLPVDISPYALENLKDSLAEEIPNLSVKTMQGDYFDVLKKLREAIKPRVALFLGSNLGNMSDARAQQFMHALGHNLNNGDRTVIGRVRLAMAIGLALLGCLFAAPAASIGKASLPWTVLRSAPRSRCNSHRTAR